MSVRGVDNGTDQPPTDAFIEGIENDGKHPFL